MSLSTIIRNIPKAELHLHVEGSLSPELMWRLAKKHSITLPYASVEEIEKAYNFRDLQSFLDIYYAGANVLREEEDFFELMWAYLSKCHEQNIVHTEIMFDPQTHTERGIGFDIFMPGFLKAMAKAEELYGVTSLLIMSFLRHLPEASAFSTLEAAKPYYEYITAVGLDSSELGHPPSKFERVFEGAKKLGFKIVAHAGEEGPADYIWQAIDILGVNRIDHGVRCLEDDALTQFLKESQLPLTVCPLSNLKLRVVDDMKKHNIVTMLNKGLLVTVNSDDPTYFGGFLNENFEALVDALGIDEATVKTLAANSFKASFMSEEKKRHYIDLIDTV